MYKGDRATSHDLSHRIGRLGFEHNVLCDLLFNTWDVVCRLVADDAAAWNRNRTVSVPTASRATIQETSHNCSHQPHDPTTKPRQHFLRQRWPSCCEPPLEHRLR